ncbi:ABC transporter ATP-binding protein [Microterricola pindariensis]|uniref:Iron-dicitrate transporter ATP-binding subunit n=1 Tax=Microterricola pindariensis TaxID=478010 RepID=A0ABX5AZ04_9MICO|nr:ABC transporter ATP-binding protein [Microterricola pindariensis]PPL20125.1 iron-dicitrate transporter ATP-binding subunit [Microterricola pindariensis]
MLGIDLTLAYNGTAVVHGADITLAPGQITALVGPNGSGKSTLLRALARLHAPQSGRIELPAEGADPLDALSLGQRDFARRVTLLAQSRPTPAGLSVREVVEFGRHPHRGRWTRGDADGAAAIEHAMAVTGVDSLAERPVDRLSGGQLQRVWLASCLAQGTGVLLLDEPTTYLDLRYQVELLDLVRDLAEVHGVTIGVVLHDLDQAAAIADHVVLLADGRVRAAGSPERVLTTELLSAAYGIRVEVQLDERSGQLRTRALGRHNAARAPERAVA